MGKNDLWGCADNLVGAYSPWTLGGAWDLPTNVTITSTPPGLPISVDGTAYSTPHTFPWDAGDSHTLSAPSTSPGSSGAQYQFASWSDQGP